MTTAHAVFALVALAFAAAAGVLLVLGWLTDMQDGAARFRRRLWAWICLTGFLYVTFTGIDHKRWWDWVWIAFVGGYAISRVRHWWRATEQARALARIGIPLSKRGAA